MNALEIKKLCKAYPDFYLDNIELALPQGCIMGLVGENGAGKSTVIKLILDMIKRDSGTVSIFGYDNRDNMKLTKEDIGVVLDEVGISGCLTAAQVGRIMKNTYKNWDSAAYERLTKAFGLAEKKPFKDFSKGMKMKLGIAVAMSHRARLLILDEATSGLDPVARDEVLELIGEFTRDEGHSVLISSHIVSDLEKICDYIAFLHKGKLILCEEKDRLTEKYGIVRGTAQQISELDEAAVIGKKETPYGAEAIVNRDGIPVGFTVSPVDIEQLFIFMVK